MKHIDGFSLCLFRYHYLNIFSVSCFPLQSKIVRVLNLWQKNGVFKIEVIQPLLDMAAGSSSAAALYTGADEPGKCVFSFVFHI